MTPQNEQLYELFIEKTRVHPNYILTWILKTLGLIEDEDLEQEINGTTSIYNEDLTRLIGVIVTEKNLMIIEKVEPRGTNIICKDCNERIKSYGTSI